MGQDSAMQQGLEEFGATPNQPPQLVKPKLVKMWFMKEGGGWQSLDVDLEDVKHQFRANAIRAACK